MLCLETLGRGRGLVGGWDADGATATVSVAGEDIANFAKAATKDG